MSFLHFVLALTVLVMVFSLMIRAIPSLVRIVVICICIGVILGVARNLGIY